MRILAEHYLDFDFSNFEPFKPL